MHKKTARDIDVNSAEIILWNGAPSVAEMPNFTKGTTTIIDILVERTRAGATTILGGGDSAAVEQAGAASEMTQVSSGGGAR